MNFEQKYFSSINIPSTVKIEKKEKFLIFSGVLGFTKLDLTKIDPIGYTLFKISKDEKTLFLFGRSKPLFYSIKRLLTNKIQGVTVGFRVCLRLVGVGYRAFLEKKNILDQTRIYVYNFKCGYSHNIQYNVPYSVRALCLDPTTFHIFGIDKNQVSQVGHIIRAFKFPERYKGKGIRFTHETVSLYIGKRK